MYVVYIKLVPIRSTSCSSCTLQCNGCGHGYMFIICSTDWIVGVLEYEIILLNHLFGFLKMLAFLVFSIDSFILMFPIAHILQFFLIETITIFFPVRYHLILTTLICGQTDNLICGQTSDVSLIIIVQCIPATSGSILKHSDARR